MYGYYYILDLNAYTALCEELGVEVGDIGTKVGDLYYLPKDQYQDYLWEYEAVYTTLSTQPHYPEP